MDEKAAAGRYPDPSVVPFLFVGKTTFVSFWAAGAGVDAGAVVFVFENLQRGKI